MLKNILRLLLSRFYSKNESALVARQSLPDTSEYVDWSSSAVVGKQGTYICPDDGYVVIAAKSGSNMGVNVWGSLDIGVAGASGIQPKVFCPCRKGTVINYVITGEIHLTRFYKFIGGCKTIKLLLQGGGLCLNSLSSSLQRSSLSVKRSGRQSNQRFLRAIQPCSLLLPTEKTITSQCPAQGTPTCAVMVFGLPILTGAPPLTSGLMRTGISASISTPKKVNSLDMLLGLVPNSLRLISIFTRPKAVSNLAVGGASC